MRREPLDIARWGFESNCVVCERTNDAELRDGANLVRRRDAR